MAELWSRLLRLKKGMELHLFLFISYRLIYCSSVAMFTVSVGEVPCPVSCKILRQLLPSPSPDSFFPFLRVCQGYRAVRAALHETWGVGTK